MLQSRPPHLSYDDSSSDDNLFDVDEWKRTKSVFEEESKEEESVKESLHTRINSVVHTIDHSFSSQKFENIIQNLKIEANSSNKHKKHYSSTSNQLKSYSPYSPRNELTFKSSKNTVRSQSYNPQDSKLQESNMDDIPYHYGSYSFAPKPIPPIRASKNEIFKNEISCHALGNNLLLDDIINEMADDPNGDISKAGDTNLYPMAEPDHPEVDDDIDNDDIDNDVIHYINNVETNAEENGNQIIIGENDDEDEKKNVSFETGTRNILCANKQVSETMECESIQKCVALKRIITCLDFYENIVGVTDDNAVINQYFDNYHDFLDDYYHILSQHLNNGKKANKANFEIIYNKICKYIECDLSKCNAYCRMNRDRDDEVIDNNVNNNDMNAQFYIDIMDTIHCLFIHSYDCGYRINTAKLMEGTSDEMEQDAQTEFESLYNDQELRVLRRYLLKKRAELLSVKGQHFKNMNKFNNKLFNTNQSVFDIDS